MKIDRPRNDTIEGGLGDGVDWTYIEHNGSIGNMLYVPENDFGHIVFYYHENLERQLKLNLVMRISWEVTS